jgi:hypothetical protein
MNERNSCQASFTRFFRVYSEDMKTRAERLAEITLRRLGGIPSSVPLTPDSESQNQNVSSGSQKGEYERETKIKKTKEKKERNSVNRKKPEKLKNSKKSTYSQKGKLIGEGKLVRAVRQGNITPEALETVLTAASKDPRKLKVRPLDKNGKPRRVNIRRAMAGVYLQSGYGSLKQCLIRAGFEETTASNPETLGLSAERCLEEAKFFENNADPSSILSLGRLRMAESLAVLDPLRTPIKDVARAYDVVEKYHGRHTIPVDANPLALGDRFSVIINLVNIAAERGLPLPGIDRLLAGAKAVASCETEPPSAYVNSEKVETSTDNEATSDNGHYVNPLPGAPA